MDTPDITPTPSSGPKKKVLFLIGIIFGILLGALLTMFITDWLDYRRPTEVRVLTPQPSGKGADTVVKYVVHRHETAPEEQLYHAVADTARVDTAFADDSSQDLYLDEDGLADADDDEVVVTEKMIARQMLKIQYLDNNKKEIPVPENAPAEIQFQQWETPVRNKLSYQLTGNILKVKGMSAQNVKIVHYRGKLYLVRGHQAYPLTPNMPFDRLVEDYEAGL